MRRAMTRKALCSACCGVGLAAAAAFNNALDAKWREAQFAETSRVSPTADLVEQMHFTPGLPATATVSVHYVF